MLHFDPLTACAIASGACAKAGYGDGARWRKRAAMDTMLRHNPLRALKYLNFIGCFDEKPPKGGSLGLSVSWFRGVRYPGIAKPKIIDNMLVSNLN
jgi:hypothetical protein